MKRKCKMAVVGFGQRGCAYVKMIMDHPAAELTAVCEASPDRAESFARELGLKGVPIFRSVEDLIARGDFEAVVITLPDYLHGVSAIACCNAGKHVMLEKPMAPTAAECREIIQAIIRNNCKVQIGFVLRHHPIFRRVIEIARSGELGQILNITSTEHIGVMHGASYMRRWHRKTANSGGFILAKCSHDIDIISTVAGAPAVRVASFGSLDFFTPDKLKYRYCSQCPDETCRFRFKGEMVRMSESEKNAPSKAEKPFDLCVYNDDKDVVDHQVAIIDYANGVKANFALNLFAQVAKRTICVAGTEAILYADTADESITLHNSVTGKTRKIDCKAENTSGHGGSDEAFLDDFIDCVLSDRPSGVDFRAGLSSTVIGNAIEEARLTNKVVEIPQEAYLW
ncbi:MAG: Gfo/Idh/MocA family oxidoreductase [Lentisphaeria bacterium]|nr:Gfo/Idh/MocA family oxidoreductase [Lentisphaeria bacterium]